MNYDKNLVMKRSLHRNKIQWMTILATSLLSSCATLPNSNDSICARINAFEKAPFVDKQTHRSVTLSWMGDWMDFENGFGKNCMFSESDTASKELCEWLPDNTSTEFPNRVPMSILECYGYDFPSASTWSGWQSSVDIWTKRDEPILLEIDFSGKPQAIRVTVFASEHGTYDDDFIPLMIPEK